MGKTQILIFRALFFAALSLTAYLAFTPTVPAAIEEIWDKLQHVAAFLVLAGLCDFGFPSTQFSWNKALILFAYGFSIELVQFVLPYRSFSPADMLADLIGIGCYWLLIPLLRQTPGARARWAETSRLC